MAAKDEVTKLWAAYDEARAAIGKAHTLMGGGKKDESRYDVAFQALVRAGLVRQIRNKYRRVG